MPKPKSAAELRERNRAFANATKPCDLVLKGGAASGFIYSGTIVELARTYRLQSIGGTSAGAGAAGVAAAAEYGRRSGNPEAWGFAGIEHVPEWAAEKTANGWTRLKHLFGPDPKTARLYEVVSAPFTASKGGLGKAFCAALRGYWLGTAGGIAIAAAAACWLLWLLGPSLAPAVVIVALACLAGVLLALGFVGYAVWHDATVVLAANHYGLCSAKSEPDETPDRMTGWLYGLYQQLAGKPMDKPLTFGDLWDAPRREGERGICLNLMSVNLSLGRPVRITCDEERHALEEDEKYWFDPADFERLFPKHVVAAMVAAGEDEPGGQIGRFLPFPRMSRVPVIVGVRMSFALPVLFSAVRLYKRDATRLPVEHAAGEKVPEAALEPCWFVDGGVCTSLPIHLFDKPMPRWPTFAVNLRRTHPDAHGSDRGPLRVWMDHEFATNPAHGWLREWWKRIDVNRDRARAGTLRPGACRDAAQAPARRDVRDRDRLGRRRAAAPGDLPRPRRPRLPGRGGRGVQRRHRFRGDPPARAVRDAGRRKARRRGSLRSTLPVGPSTARSGTSPRCSSRRASSTISRPASAPAVPPLRASGRSTAHSRPAVSSSRRPRWA